MEWAEGVQGKGQWSADQKAEKHGPGSIECPKQSVKIGRNWGRLVGEAAMKLYGTTWEQDLDLKKLKLEFNLRQPQVEICEHRIV